MTSITFNGPYDQLLTHDHYMALGNLGHDQYMALYKFYENSKGHVLVMTLHIVPMGQQLVIRV
jgi:hypothetical protein